MNLMNLITGYGYRLGLGIVNVDSAVLVST